MPNIQLPWVNGLVLMKRWGISERELWIAISGTGLPVYNSDYEQETEEIYHAHLERGETIITKVNIRYTFKWILTAHDEFGSQYEYKEALESVLQNLLFKMEDVRAFEKEHGFIKKDTSNAGQEQLEHSKADLSSSQVGTDFDEFFDNLWISFVKETTKIRITGPNLGLREFTCEDMGFKVNAQTWKPFIEVLTNSDNYYHADIYDLNKNPDNIKHYNAQLKQLSNFSLKFVSFLNSKYHLSLPEKRNVFTNIKEFEGAGTYKTVFHVGDYCKNIDKPVRLIGDDHDAVQNTDIKNMTREETIQKIETLTSQIKRDGNECESKQYFRLQEVSRYAEHARKKRWISDEQLRKIITSPDQDAPPQDAMSGAEQLNEHKLAANDVDLPSSEELPF